MSGCDENCSYKIGDGEFSVRVKSGDPNEIVRLWKIIQDQIVEKMDNYEAIGSTSMNECWHSLLYTTGLLNKAFRYSPIQTDIAIAISVLWFNESEEHVIREITHICDTEHRIYADFSRTNPKKGFR